MLYGESCDYKNSVSKSHCNSLDYAISYFQTGLQHISFLKVYPLGMLWSERDKHRVLAQPLTWVARENKRDAVAETSQQPQPIQNCQSDFLQR